MKYFGNNTFYGESKDRLFHRADYGTADSTSKEKGTDNKLNNTSAYNHAYYMKNKDKWKDNEKVSYKEYDESDKDFDDSNYSEANRLAGNFHGFQKPDGSWVVLEEDMKWTIPSGTSKEEIIKAINSIKGGPREFTTNATNAFKALGASGKQEFDVDAAAMDVIRGKYGNGEERKRILGDDWGAVQRRVDQIYAEKGLGKGSGTSTASEKKTTRSFDEVKKDYYDKKGK